MKLKLAQRLLVSYYITQFKALALVSPRRAAEKAFDLFCTPLPVKKHKKPPAAFETATRTLFRFEGMAIRGYQWVPAHANGKKVMVLHGFSSQVFKFDKYVQPLLKAGFEVYMFDAPAHGFSEGKRITAVLYKKILLEADRQFGPFYAMIGHSLGALAASLAFEEIAEPEQRKLVLIAPATETETAIANFFRVIKVDPAVKEHFRALIREVGGKDIDYFSVNRAVRHIPSAILWVHDRHDSICPIKDIQPTLQASPAHIRFQLTEHLGHNRIYKDAGVIRDVVSFLEKGS
ncbi:alpha/beta hydrolase [Sediminibacterium soli]|uniref:alpha/beta hydrolase n=1 Tax=Sediminibacterium soli TaxID=2698829 RepID=UPI00137B4D09|nr:alpha/beta hydrolase [Sediminibacterium soli]NCI47082.1 alpha/beta fold hydrolase [Sediminibacterium soli]